MTNSFVFKKKAIIMACYCVEGNHLRFLKLFSSILIFTMGRQSFLLSYGSFFFSRMGPTKQKKKKNTPTHTHTHTHTQRDDQFTLFNNIAQSMAMQQEVIKQKVCAIVFKGGQCRPRLFTQVVMNGIVQRYGGPIAVYRHRQF